MDSKKGILKKNCINNLLIKILLVLMIFLIIINHNYSFGSNIQEKYYEISNFTLEFEKPVYKNGDTIKFKANWKLDDDSEKKIWKSGDKIIINLPEELECQIIPNLGEFAKGEYNKTENQIIYTFTDKINYKINRRGSLGLNLKINIENYNKETIEKPIIITDLNGDILFNQTIKISDKEDDRPIKDGKGSKITEKLSKGHFRYADYLTGNVDWWVRVNYSGSLTGPIIIQDTLTGPHKFLKENFTIHKTYTNGYTMDKRLEVDGVSSVDITDEVDIRHTDNGFLLYLYPNIIGRDKDGDNIVEMYDIRYKTQFNGSEKDKEKAIYLNNKIELFNEDTINPMISQNVSFEYNYFGNGEAETDDGNLFIKLLDEKRNPIKNGKFNIKHSLYKEKNVDIITDENGVAKVNFSNVDKTVAGKYILTELDLPFGYENNKDEIIVVPRFMYGQYTEEVIRPRKTIDFHVKKYWENIDGDFDGINLVYNLVNKNTGEIIKSFDLAAGENSLDFLETPIVDKDGNTINYDIIEIYKDETDEQLFEKTIVSKEDNTYLFTTKKIDTREDISLPDTGTGNNIMVMSLPIVSIALAFIKKRYI